MQKGWRHLVHAFDVQVKVMIIALVVAKAIETTGANTWEAY
jgi:hypothetical protein